jgi:hypothetical protein
MHSLEDLLVDFSGASVVRGGAFSDDRLESLLQTNSSVSIESAIAFVQRILV